MTLRMASRRLPSRENTSPTRCLTISRVRRCGGTAVAVPAIVATAAALFDLTLNFGSGALPQAGAATSGFGVRRKDKGRLSWLGTRVLGGKDTRRQTSDRKSTRLNSS